MKQLIWLSTILLSLNYFSCQPSGDSPPASDRFDQNDRQGTQQMIDSLKAIYGRTNFRKHPYASTEDLALIEQEVNKASQENNLQIELYIEYGLKLLDAGQTAKAIEVYTNLINQFPANKVLTSKNKGLYDALAIGYLRLAEQENCILNHSEESCIFPIRGKGIHTKKEGSQKAIEVYRQLLEKFPDDLQSRWLLNIAYMTLGEYPDGVPAQWLIPPTSFASEYKLPAFRNIAQGLHLDINDLAGGTISDDFDNDGLIDLVASSWGMKDQIRFFKNTGDGGFEDRTEGSGLLGLTGGLNLKQADYNNDGFLDFIILRGAWNAINSMGVQPNSLIRNNGDGTFSDVTIKAGMYSVNPTQSAVWADFNLDGWIDLYIANETHIETEKHPSEFYLNNGDGTFSEIAGKLNIAAVGYFKGVGAADVNNDGRPELYLSNLKGKNLLFANIKGKDPQELAFKEVAAAAGVQEPEESFPLWFFDYDNDGDEDLFVLAFDRFAFKQQAWELTADWLNLKMNADYPRLYQNRGDGTFADVTSATRLDRALHTMGCNFGDLDNDGYLDFYLGTGAPDFRSIVPNRMMRNNAGKDFQDVTTSGRFGHLQKGHGIGFADFDNDGDQDIYAVMGGSVSGDVFQNAFFQNPGNDNHWITLKLEGSSSNKAAIGARIKISIQEAGGATRTIYSTVSSGASFGANSLQQEIGLGKAEKILNLEINWPNDHPAFIDFGSPEMDRRYRVTEGSNKLTPFPLQPILLKTEGGHHHH